MTVAIRFSKLFKTGILKENAEIFAAFQEYNAKKIFPLLAKLQNYAGMWKAGKKEKYQGERKMYGLWEKCTEF